MKIDSKVVAGYIIFFTVSSLLTSYLLIDNQYIKLPNSYLLPHKKIIDENQDIWNNEEQLKESIDRDKNRSNYIQDDFVVDFPIFSDKLSVNVINQLQWLSTQSIAQYGFMTIYNYLSKNNPNIQLVQSKHIRKIKVEDYKMEYMFCCDLVDINEITNILGHICNNIIITWNNEEITKIEMKIYDNNLHIKN